jgi:hypothetical protein
VWNQKIAGFGDLGATAARIALTITPAWNGMGDERRIAPIWTGNVNDDRGLR